MKIVQVSWRCPNGGERVARSWKGGITASRTVPEHRLVRGALDHLDVPDDALDLEVRVGWAPTPA